MDIHDYKKFNCSQPPIQYMNASDAIATAITHALQPKVHALPIKGVGRLSVREGRLVAHAA